MKCAVLPDTNVVVAASVHAKSDVLDIVVSEPHHDESRLLLDAFLDPGSDGWCVASPTVIGEVYRVTRRAATQATHRAFTKQRVKKGGVWVSEMGRIVEHCVNESFRLVSSMAKYDLHPFSVEAKLVEVDKMTEDIKKRYRDTALETAFGSPRGVPGSPGGSGLRGRTGSRRVWAGRCVAVRKIPQEGADRKHYGQEDTRRGRGH